MDKYFVATVINADGEQVLTALYHNREKAINNLIADYEEELQNILSMGEKIENEVEELRENLNEFGEYYVSDLASTYYIKEVVLKQ